MAGLAYRRLRNLRGGVRKIDFTGNPRPVVRLLQELDGHSKGMRRFRIRGPRKDEPAVRTPGDDPGMLFGDGFRSQRLRSVHHDETFLVQGGEGADELLHAGDGVPIQEAPEPRVRSGIVRRGAVRLETVESRQVLEQAFGKRGKAVVIEAQVFEEEQLIEDAHRESFQQVSVQTKDLQ